VTWTVHKFGGTSLADAACFKRVADIVVGQPEGNLAVVVSAVGGVTDLLLGLIDKASRDQPVEASIDGLRSRYEAIVRELLSEERANRLIEQFSEELENIGSVLKALSVVKAASHRSRDLVAGFGELWSARLLAALLDESNRRRGAVACVDARDVLVVERGEMGPIVAWEPTREKCEQVIPDDYDGVVVVTGFIARNREGLQTTLGRNGSDYSASIFGGLLGATAVHIWTDVEGVMSGDPRRVPEARVIDQISYSEAMELAYFGAKVIHPQTMAPAVAHEIPIRIRGTFSPDSPGTEITATPGEQDALVKGISGIDGVALVNLEGAGMIGVPGTADRLFGALREEGISVTLISQGSSEHSICFAVPQESSDHSRQGRRRKSVRRGTFPGPGTERRGDQGLWCTGGRRRRYGGAPRGCGPFFQNTRQRRHQRSRHRPGRLRTQYLRRHRFQRHDPGVTRRPRQLLPLGQDCFDRADRAGFGGERPAGPDGWGGGPATGKL
jgi:aspartokinase/homoserine dehydrogenase 1